MHILIYIVITKKEKEKAKKLNIIKNAKKSEHYLNDM